MERLEPYLGITIAVLVAIFVVSLPNKVTVERASPTGMHTASSTVAVVPAAPVIEVPSLEPKASAPTTSPAVVPEKKVVPTSKPVPVPVAAPVPTPAPVVPSAAETNAALDASASVLRTALVNIICYVPAGSGLHSISGSGVFIDSKGIILTNAHVAQYFLLADKGADCTIRMGSPAIDKYDAALIYISPKWLRANANVLTQTLPIGTGEYDFAFLAVSKSATTSPLPGSFPSIPLATNPPVASTSVVIATYGAQFIESSQVQFSLFPTIVFGSVKDVFTFATSTIDVLALGGSVAAQEGSSGGGVADATGKLIGTITTSTVEGATDTRSLDAITVSYIRGEYANETGQALDLLLAQDPPTAATAFAPQIPALEALLTAHLP